MAIVESKSAPNYQWILEEVQKNCTSMRIIFNPKHIVADNVYAISVASYNEFSNIKKVHCCARTWRLMGKTKINRLC